MDEPRKRVLLIAASIIAARRLSNWRGGALMPEHVAAISDSVRIAEKIMAEIDRQWPYRGFLRDREDMRH